MGSEWPPAAKTGPSKYGKTKLLNILNVHILSLSDLVSFQVSGESVYFLHLLCTVIITSTCVDDTEQVVLCILFFQIYIYSPPR